MTTLPVVLSSGAVSIVKVGDIVKAGQLIAKRESHTDYVVNLAHEFSSPIEKVRKTLRIKPGDNVKEGDVLAVKKNLFGLSEEKLLSRVTGTFSRYERDTGNLIISRVTQENFPDIVSPVDGTVSICDNDKIVIATDKDVYLGRKGSGGSAIGEVFVLDGAFSKDGETGESAISLYYDLDSRAVEKIVVGRNFRRDLLIKCIGMGAIGIVGTEIRDEDIEYLAQRNMKVPIIEVDNNTIEQTKQWKGKRFYLNSQEKVIIFLHA